MPKLHIGDLTSVLGILSAMITPAVLIMACGSLILTTSSRLVRAVDRVREMLPDFEAMAQAPTDEATEFRHRHMLDQVERLTTRARLLQRALTDLYLALSAFLATSIAIGVISLAGIDWPAVPLTLGFVGALLLFAASVLLIIESRIALTSNYAEMQYIRALADRHSPEALRRTERSVWRLFK